MMKSSFWIGSAIWNLVATALKMPISGTHSIIGATIGFTLVLKGVQGVQWGRLRTIALSWLISPLLAGAISSVIYVIIYKMILDKKDPIRSGLSILPIFYGFAILVNVGSIIIHTRGMSARQMAGDTVIRLIAVYILITQVLFLLTGDEDPDSFWPLDWQWGSLISLIVSGVTITLVALCLVPRLKADFEEDELRFKARQRKSMPQKTIIKQTKFSAEIKPADGQVNPVFEPDAKAPVQSSEICLDPNKLMNDGDSQGVSQSTVHEQKEDKPEATTSPEGEKSEEMVEIDLSAETSKGSSDKSVPTGDKVVAIDNADNKDDPNTDDNAGKFQSDLRQLATMESDNLNKNIAKLFASLQIMTACFASFAHGTNDVSNAVAPLVPIWNVYSTGVEDISQHTPLWILVFGGIGICAGLWAWGRSVMETVGDGLTKLTPAKGFSIELGAAMAVLFATKFGMPISTTHCKVGSVVIVGLVSSKFLSPARGVGQNSAFAKRHSLPFQGQEEVVEEEKAVDWKLFGSIALTWVVTVPLAAMSSAIIMFILQCVTV